MLVIWRKDIIVHFTTTSSSLLAEDEQRNKLSSQKALQAVTAEKEAALADLNSVERSLSDIFRRYENMKSTLEGFKKVGSRETRSRVQMLLISQCIKCTGKSNCYSQNASADCLKY